VARVDEDHFRASISLMHLSMIALEQERWDAAIANARELASFAKKLGEGSEGPFATAVDAIARRRLGEPGAEALVERALAGLREIDSKGHLAYAQTHAAEIALVEKKHANAAERAKE